MGLNDSGLESLSSITASELFDVAITGTNSPIQQGDTLTVSYTVDNTGDTTGTQDITLEIDTVLEDTDAGVRVLANRSGSGTLEWVTASDEVAQNYTATVASADDSASQTVTIESASAIPDSGIVHEWPISDNTSPVPDAEGTADITLNGGVSFDNTTESWWGDYALSFDATDDYGVVDANRTDVGDVGSILLTVRFDSINSTGSDWVFSHPGITNDNRIYIRTDNGSDALEVLIADASRLILEGNPSVDTLYRIGMAWDNGTMEGYLNGTSKGTVSYTGTVNSTVENWYFGTFDGTSQDLGGYIDFPRLTTERWSDQQFQDDYDAQPWSP